jgi:hypothetical protein
MSLYKNSEESKSTTIWITIGAIFGLGLIAFLLLSTYGVFNNYISYDARFSPWYMKVIGTIILSAVSAYCYIIIKDNSKGSAWSGLLILPFITLALAFNVNFKFSSGDKQQQETVFNANGSFQVDKLDKWIKENKEAYQEKGIDLTDTSFINYVKKYSELPGINKNHSLIRLGELPKSTAPRANEDFPLPNDLK